MQNRLQGKKVAVVGLGISNIAAISYLLKQDLSGLSVFDTRTNPPYTEELPGNIDFHLGPLDAELLKQYDMLVVSPGLSTYTPELKVARDAGAEIVGDIELFAGEAKAPVIGITGSNGKSTVTALVGFMMEKAGLNAPVGANFGQPVFDILSDRAEAYVLELSSFELETTSSLQVETGVILNVSEDHLDRYEGDIEKYADAKQRIFMHCNKIIVNRDDPRTYPQDKSLHNKIFASFGLDNQDYGREVVDNHVYLTIHGQRVLDTRELIICGTHNELNALAAMAIADSMGISRDVQIQALKNFQGLEHRCQLVRVLDGVSFYNDSKATNVASAEAAISGLSRNHKEGLILLAGGIGKGQDFTPLKRFFGKEVVKVFCFGRDADKIIALDPEVCVDTLNIRQATRLAFAAAKQGQAVLLSPACASFDQFKGFEDRGRIYTDIVNNLTSLNLAQIQAASKAARDASAKAAANCSSPVSSICISDTPDQVYQIQVEDQERAEKEAREKAAREKAAQAAKKATLKTKTDKKSDLKSKSKSIKTSSDKMASDAEIETVKVATKAKKSKATKKATK